MTPPRPSTVPGFEADLSDSCTGFLYDAAKTFSHYYHDNRILNAETKELVKARTMLCYMISVVMKNGFALIGVPFLEAM